MTPRTLILHMPVVHRGYLNFFRRIGSEVRTAHILGDDAVERFRFYEADRSSLSASEAREIVAALNIFDAVRVAGLADLAALGAGPLVMVGDELSRRLAEELLAYADIRWESVFLRWDESHVQRALPAAYRRQSAEPFDRAMIEAAYAEAEKSSDWWRRVGAVLVRDGAIVNRTYNRDMPDDQSSYRFGNIRDYLKPGERPEFSNTFHAENRMVAEAASAGVRTAGAALYVTHFPCPMCAKAIAVSGITRCYFAEGSANFDAQMILDAHGVELIHVPREFGHA